jgi:hypothetical protein
MNAITRIEGRLLTNKLTSGFMFTHEHDLHVRNAIKGSQMLRDAILRAKGYPVAEPEVIAAVAPPPMFKPRKAKPSRPKGRPRGWLKVRRRNPKIAEINALVAAHFKLSLDAMAKPSRKHEVAHPRQIAMYLARKRTTASLADIGFEYGGKDHTTVRHAIIKVEKRIADNDVETIEAIRAVHKVIGA